MYHLWIVGVNTNILLHAIKLLKIHRGTHVDIYIAHNVLAESMFYRCLLSFQLSLLQQKLHAELPNDAIVVAGRFPLPDWTPCRIEGHGVDRAWAYSMKAQRQHSASKNDSLSKTDCNNQLTSWLWIMTWIIISHYKYGFFYFPVFMVCCNAFSFYLWLIIIILVDTFI